MNNKNTFVWVNWNWQEISVYLVCMCCITAGSLNFIYVSDFFLILKKKEERLKKRECHSCIYKHLEFDLLWYVWVIKWNWKLLAHIKENRINREKDIKMKILVKQQWVPCRECLSFFRRKVSLFLFLCSFKIWKCPS